MPIDLNRILFEPANQARSADTQNAGEESLPPHLRPFGRRECVLYACTVLAWSASWYALKVNMSTGIPAPVSITWRFVIAALAMGLWAQLSGQSLRFPASRHWQFAALGVFLFSTNFILFYVASLYVVSGLLAVVFSLASIINLTLATLRGERSPGVRWLGAACGVAGIAMLYSQELSNNAHVLTGLALCIGGTLCFCVGNLVSQALQGERIPVLAASAWGMAWGALWSAVLSVAFGYDFRVDTSASYVLSMIFLILVSTLLAFWAYLNLIGRIGAGRAAYATVMFPIGALLVSTVMEDWTWTPVALSGVTLALLGNVLVLRRGAKPQG